MNIHTIKKGKLMLIPWLFLALILFVLSAVVVFSVIPKSLAAQTTMEVYQQEGRKAFGQGTELDIFNDPKLGGQKLIHPFAKGSYTFAVYNNSTSAPLPYSLGILTTNPDDIPLVFSLRKNGEYVYGGEGGMIPLSEFSFPETELSGSKTDLYTINWEWKTEDDTIDTDIGRNGTQLYKLVITATGTMPEINDLPPKTGDTANILLWFAIMLAGLVLLFVVLFYKRRKGKGEDNQAVPENK